MLAILGAAIAGGSAALGWRSDTRKDDWRFALLVATASALIVAAATLALPVWAVAPASALVASALLAVRPPRRRSQDRDLRLGVRSGDDRIAARGGSTAPSKIAQPAAPLPPTGRRHSAGWCLRELPRCSPRSRPGPGAKQWPSRSRYCSCMSRWRRCCPHSSSRWSPPCLLVALALALRPPPLPALIASWFLVLLWAIAPAMQWLDAAIWSLTGVPFLSTGVPEPVGCRHSPRFAGRGDRPRAAPRRAFRPRSASSSSDRPSCSPRSPRTACSSNCSRSTADPRFDALGYAERTLWEAQLAALALLAWQWRQTHRRPSRSPPPRSRTSPGTAWRPQSLVDVQAAPVCGSSRPTHSPSPSFGRRERVGLLPQLDRARDWARMLLIPLLGLSLLRLAFAGPILSAAPIGQAEDILRSLLGALIAIGFLQYGIRAAKRDWRIASLALMLATVAKVFLRDASGLDGLVRVGVLRRAGLQPDRYRLALQPLSARPGQTTRRHRLNDPKRTLGLHCWASMSIYHGHSINGRPEARCPCPAPTPSSRSGRHAATMISTRPARSAEGTALVPRPDGLPAPDGRSGDALTGRRRDPSICRRKSPPCCTISAARRPILDGRNSARLRATWSSRCVVAFTSDLLRPLCVRIRARLVSGASD